MPPPVDIHQIPALLKELARKSSSGKERAAFEELLATTQPVLQYMERQPAIEAASKAIEPHRQAFDALREDEEAYMERTRTLFAEERFAPLRFTAEDVERAFEKVGYPKPGSSSDDFVATVRQAILHLAEKERRSHLGMALVMHLPDYVAAKRPLDAWILQHCSYLTTEVREESNPFLFQMFSYGYNGWVAKKRASEEALLRQVGMDLSRLEGMNMDEINAWLEEQAADPAKLARLEKVMLANPQQRAQVEAELEKLERDAYRLLEREDAAHLWLSPAEVQPWLFRLYECWESQREQLPDVESPSPNPAAGEAFMKALFPLLSDMVAKLFTPERVRELTARLKTYRNARHAAGDKETAAQVNGAIVSLGNGRDPETCQFLYALSYLSLMKTAEEAANPESDQSTSPDETDG